MHKNTSQKTGGCKAAKLTLKLSVPQKFPALLTTWTCDAAGERSTLTAEAVCDRPG